MKLTTSFATALIAAVNATKIIYLPPDLADTKLYKPPREKYPFVFPWPKNDPICGATMVSPQHIATAAHCISKDMQIPFDIELRGKTYSVNEVRPMSCWNSGPNAESINEKFPSDVAVMVLEKPIPNPKVGVDYINIWNPED